MQFAHFTSDFDERTVVVTRVGDRQWQAEADDRVVGSAEASPRPDGRLFLSVDTWHETVFDRLAGTMLAQLPKPLYTVADNADAEVYAGWRRAGLVVRRREREYVVTTDPRVTGLTAGPPPDGVRILPAGTTRETPLREAYAAIRAEVEAAAGWDSMPAEVLARPDGTPLLDPLKFVAAVLGDQYVGLLRLTPLRRPRIGLVAVRSQRQRRGIARALLAHVLGALHHTGIPTASAEVDESNTAGIALFEGIGARWTASSTELVQH
ncbi:GNAT family N-acetyltransferase [Amycolatopsis jiangsuensis]|uniref:Ribosomal protein S18 acetylase RimI-like enzyme n=1 Tax=Amycolatopsis jiangsuensis TaxID=1181879 RepID=A0A840J580_9PSEU|nr:GNAT family N-acetyltransferase [Amycolatopsis jiangsuensis]MBB4688879.1 ribosomal protein S18 acetylase RimI-like enzyme [Amycolatopsis jiangsuensis]